MRQANHGQIPRPEHPEPQFQRNAWVNLNGVWTCRLDPGRSGREAGWACAQQFEQEILVPFCPESRLSGLGHTDFIPAIWYHRRITVPRDWAGRRVLLHLGGVDYQSEVFIDGRSAGIHFGGSVRFTCDITRLVRPGGEHHLVVHAIDQTRCGHQPGGKQSHRLHSHGCYYTRTTGIWQTVWLEATDPCGLADVQILPDLDDERFVVLSRFHATRRGLSLHVTARHGDRIVGQGAGPAVSGATICLDINDPVAWEPANPHLYDLTLELCDGQTSLDTVKSYAGLRKVHIEGSRVYLNNKPLYQRLVLDQGFYPDGIWTAPTDDALRRDIQLSMAAGFNGARLHQKVFEPRFHYWADRLGYLTWGESASWGCDPNHPASARNFLSEWARIVMRDRNHPSIIAWTPFNETRGVTDRAQHRRTHMDAYQLCQSLDPTRPVNDASGYVHHRTDLWTIHSYEQDPTRFKALLSVDEQGVPPRNFPEDEAPYEGQPYLVDEYGGIRWNPDAEDSADRTSSWGYGQTPSDLQDFYQRLAGLTEVLRSFDHISGYCYTQLTDVEQEENGIYRYDRSAKFDLARIREIFSQKPGWAEL
jgi:beta-galactosidase/beta-glucuronidase